MAAIAKVESQGKHRAVGDHGLSLGLFQIQPHHWGKEGLEDLDNLEAQVRKADQVFDDLVEEYGYNEAIKRWNGTGASAVKYRKQVLKQVRMLQKPA